MIVLINQKEELKEEAWCQSKNKLLDYALIKNYKRISHCNELDNIGEKIKGIYVGSRVNDIPYQDKHLIRPYPINLILPIGLDKNTCRIWLDINSEKMFYFVINKGKVACIYYTELSLLSNIEKLEYTTNNDYIVRIILIRGKNTLETVDFFEVYSSNQIEGIDKIYRDIEIGDNITKLPKDKKRNRNLTNSILTNNTVYIEPTLHQEIPLKYFRRFDKDANKILYFLYDNVKIEKILYADIIKLKIEEKSEWKFPIKIDF